MAGKEIRIKITPDGKVEVDSSVFKDCKETALHLEKALGKIQRFVEKDDLDTAERIKIDTGE
ncbi:MAG TPA: hypothetical protein VFF54_00260 [Thermodesulfobacteriota bacterium]|nr:hypothetical protein [Thermodesulfobacteriota bacterium]